MTSPDSSTIAQTLLLSPDWARTGLAAPNERIREAAATQIAQRIVGALEGLETDFDSRQMALPL